MYKRRYVVVGGMLSAVVVVVAVITFVYALTTGKHLLRGG
jgi:hypothetical protein